MLHGVVAVCPRSGSLLFAKAYTASFGLPTPSGGQAMDAHNLASLVFALQLNATSVLDGNAEHMGSTVEPVDDRHSRDQHQATLKSVDMGPGLRLVFYKDPTLPGLLLMLSLDPALGERAQGMLAQRICDSFAEAFGEQLRSQADPGAALGPVRRLRGASEIVQRCLSSISQILLDDLIQTFAGEGSILWGHAMQADGDDLEMLGLTRPLEVQGAHVGGWDPLNGSAGRPDHIQELKTRPHAQNLGRNFEGVAAVGEAMLREKGDSPPPHSGYKRKAPEKLLSKCSKA